MLGLEQSGTPGDQLVSTAGGWTGMKDGEECVEVIHDAFSIVCRRVCMYVQSLFSACSRFSNSRSSISSAEPLRLLRIENTYQTQYCAQLVATRVPNNNYIYIYI